jgi:hypothetical protein
MAGVSEYALVVHDIDRHDASGVVRKVKICAI